MKILFLDVDGVLNHQQAFEDQKGTGMGSRILCPKTLAQLAYVLARTDARVVLSSTWRKGIEGANGHVAYLRAQGVLDRAHEDWKTKDWVAKLEPVGRGISDKAYGSYGCRGDEIAEWLSRHPEVKGYAIVDDDGDMLEEQKPFFVQTDFRAGGLTPEKAQEIINIFRRWDGYPPQP